MLPPLLRKSTASSPRHGSFPSRSPPPPSRAHRPRRRRRPVSAATAGAAAAAAHQRLRRGCPARRVPALGSRVWRDGGGPVPEDGLVRVPREERVNQLQLRRFDPPVPHHTPERDWLPEPDRHPTSALQLDGAGLSGFEQQQLKWSNTSRNRQSLQTGNMALQQQSTQWVFS